MLRFLFPKTTYDRYTSVGILIIRIVFGGMLITHGWGKLMNFEAMSAEFIGGSFGLGLTVFAEVFCSLGIIFGVLFRLALIPPIIAMSVAFFVAHGAKIVGEGNGENALLYLAVFVGLYIIGTGKYAADRFIANKWVQ